MGCVSVRVYKVWCVYSDETRRASIAPSSTQLCLFSFDKRCVPKIAWAAQNHQKTWWLCSRARRRTSRQGSMLMALAFDAAMQRRVELGRSTGFDEARTIWCRGYTDDAVSVIFACYAGDHAIVWGDACEEAGLKRAQKDGARFMGVRASWVGGEIHLRHREMLSRCCL